MSAAANIVVNDGQATPVAHTFGPARTTSDYAEFEDRAVGIYLGYNRLKISLKRPMQTFMPVKGTKNRINASLSVDKKLSSDGGRNLKLSFKYETPKLETVSNSTVSGIAPAPTISYRPMVETIFTFPERCSLQDRKDLKAYMANFLASSTATLAVESYELPY